MRKTWPDGDVISDGFTSLEAIQVGPVQQLHPGAEFRLFKRSLMYDPIDVLSYMKQNAPQSAQIISAFYKEPTIDPSALRIIPPPYFP